MSSIFTRIRAQRGSAMTEYNFIAATIAIVAIFGVQLTGVQSKQAFEQVGCGLTVDGVGSIGGTNPDGTSPLGGINCQDGGVGEDGPPAD